MINIRLNESDRKVRTYITSKMLYLNMFRGVDLIIWKAAAPPLREDRLFLISQSRDKIYN